jgi:hypothetical protein
MTFFQDKKRICYGCLCHILEDPEIFIDSCIFHNCICSLHYKYIKRKNNDYEIELYEKTGRNFFIDYVENHLIKFKIRDATIGYLQVFLNKIFFTN